MEQGARSKEQEPRLGGTFENLEVWRDAVELAARVYELFRDCRDYGFRSQVQEAAVSVSSNIAEGYERDSNPDFIRFLFIAKASCGEVRSLAHVASRVQLLSVENTGGLAADAQRLSKRLKRLIEIRRTDFE